MMGKIKLNLESGAVVEKPLINAFRANNFEYVILDNEMNGSMGLPIILVCKLDNGKLIKIEDQNEWQIVKEYLKNIIAGSQVELVKVPNVLPANDVYYTQLTLPVPSFDALKKAYTVAGSEPENTEGSANEINPSPVPVSEQPVEEVASTQASESNALETPVANTSTTDAPLNDSTTVIDINIPNVPDAPVIDNPNPINPAPNTSIDLNAPIPVFGDVNQTQTPVPANDTPIAPAIESASQVDVTPDIPVTPVIDQPVVEENEPVVSIAPSSETESPFKEQKEAFMQACENMFDALVQKFEKELENNK